MNDFDWYALAGILLLVGSASLVVTGAAVVFSFCFGG